MTHCDLCDKPAICLPRQIEGREHEICSPCWNSLAQKLRGKGKPKKEREMVSLPPPLTVQTEPKETKPLPGAPPKIWSGV